MQLSRVAIAAVFLVVGALLVIPMLFKGSSPSQAVSATPSTSASASPTKTAKPSHSPTHRASPTHTTKRPTHRTVTPPRPSLTSLVPFRVTIGAVRCPGRGVLVSVANRGGQAEDYTITTDGSISVADRIQAGTTRKSTVTVKEGHATTIAVNWHNVPVKTLDRTARCTHHSPGTALPHTGPDSGLIFARVATGLAAMLTGVIIFWYGRQWPRRRDRMFDEGS